jgi:hypothetical protein
VVANVTARRDHRRWGLRLAVLVVTLLWAGFCYLSAYRAFGWVGVVVLAVLSALFGVLSNAAANRCRA